MPLLGARPCSNGSKIRSSSPSLEARAAVDDADDDVAVQLLSRELDRGVRTRTRARCRSGSRARARSGRRRPRSGGGSAGERDRRRGRLGRRARRAPGRRGSRPSRARASARPRRARAARGRGGSRRADRAASLSTSIVEAGSRGPRRSARGSALSSPSVAARIAVSGERRSWLTARRIAVLIASLRRSVSASTARRPSRSRSIATAGARRARPGEPARDLGIGLGLSRKSLPTLAVSCAQLERRSPLSGRRTESSSIRVRATPSASATRSAIPRSSLCTCSLSSSAAGDLGQERRLERAFVRLLLASPRARCERR